MKRAARGGCRNINGNSAVNKGPGSDLDHADVFGRFGGGGVEESVGVCDNGACGGRVFGDNE